VPHFKIESSNKVSVTTKAATGESGRFGSEAELARLATDWKMTRLADIWNNLPGVAPVKRFKDRQTAIHRIWSAIQNSAVSDDEKDKGTKRRVVGAEGSTPTHATPSGKSTKTEQIIALLKTPSGASLKAIMAATGWQSHSVRGFVSAQLIKRMGLRVKSIKRAGERVYLIPR
jgi:hypothetical protein